MSPIYFVGESLADLLKNKIVSQPSHIFLPDSFSYSELAEKDPQALFIFLDQDNNSLRWLQKFKENLPASITPKIVILKSEPSAEFERKAMLEGARDILPVSMAPAELLKRLEKINSVSGDVSEKKKLDSILIVDDEEGVRNFLNLVFMRKGYKTYMAEGGLAALEIIKCHSPSVILLDMMMPEINGLETLRRIKELDPKVGVVMATGLNDEKLAREAMALGAYAYVTKPFDLRYLELVVLTRLCLAA